MARVRGFALNLVEETTQAMLQFRGKGEDEARQRLDDVDGTLLIEITIQSQIRDVHQYHRPGTTEQGTAVFAKKHATVSLG